MLRELVLAIGIPLLLLLSLPRPPGGSVLVSPLAQFSMSPDTLLKTRSRKVCMTCHWFRHHAGVNCIPVLTCQLHQGLIAHGEHLVSRCQGWTDDLVRQQGWAPEVA